MKGSLKKIINSNKRFFIATHPDPDGDGIGAGLALMRILLRMKKKVIFYLPEDGKNAHLFMPGIKKTVSSISGKLNEDEWIFLALDCGSIDRIEEELNFFNQRPFIVNIDHHISNTFFGDMNIVDPDASSAGLIVYRWFKRNRIKLDRDIAINLYITMVIDTGSFRFSNTTAEAHISAADLFSYNINPPKIHKNIYQNKTSNDIKMLGKIIANIQTYKKGQIAWVVLDYPEFTSGVVKPLDSQEYLNILTSMKESKLVFVLRPIENGSKTKVSIRSKTMVSAAQIMKKFGGGGHKKAAGCTIPKPLHQAKELLLKEIRKKLK